MARDPNPSGKHSIVFSNQKGYDDLPVQVPCGRCVGCRLDYSRMWALRCCHEASLHDSSCFVTLTYNDDNLPTSCSINKRVMQLFIKRLRKKFNNVKIKYFLAGEYGDQNGRPHYHLLLFGLDFPDKKPIHYLNTGSNLYASEILTELWPYGFSSIGDVNYATACYVARYCVKKITGDLAPGHYNGLTPEFALMSKGSKKNPGGIGLRWLDEFSNDVFSVGGIVNQDGYIIKSPRYYEKKLILLNEKKYNKIKKDNYKKMRLQKGENVPRRLKSKETIVQAQLNLAQRKV